MKAPSDEELDLLLSRGRLRGPVAEATRERVLEVGAASERPWWRRRRLPLVLPLVLAAAAGILLVARIGPLSTDARRDKGSAATGGPRFLGLTCSNGTPAACRPGARVTFAFGPGVRGYMGAYAQPDAGGERIWYFSGEDEPASVGGAESAQLASRSVVLGPEHLPGRYRVQLVVSARPLRRAEVLDPRTPDVLLRTEVPLTVVAP